MRLGATIHASTNQASESFRSLFASHRGVAVFTISNHSSISEKNYRADVLSLKYKSEQQYSLDVTGSLSKETVG